MGTVDVSTSSITHEEQCSDGQDYDIVTAPISFSALVYVYLRAVEGFDGRSTP